MRPALFAIESGLGRFIYLVRDGARQESCIVKMRIKAWKQGSLGDLCVTLLDGSTAVLLQDEWSPTKASAVARAKSRYQGLLACARSYAPAGAVVTGKFKPNFVSFSQWERRRRRAL